ncbi:PspC domain-containing protein [Sporolactobacillus terrae]|jgi:phage shock protein C|uniref:PspC domain-containing protein n=1 Tax=Sporolactobacillus terrae TaxID=269673 RepID=A0A410D7B0_9BACL|nr:PspC domain-containing protein [Sporolactobacillus terrae]QAA21983.1 PspC domain-containing protein [Sporolactobacillus terrae]QAA24956.1 PspC domain-containing protein [Sporolactobacillus terrae]UAK16778.1 PspC domain-containing protein [Sporolactobacillus terrae]BBN98260.1 PspC domain-containing protein [Sporolactobacillus terrae]
MQKRLYKSSDNRMLTGVLGGIGEFFHVDPTLVRLGFVVLALVTVVFPCLIGYFIAYLIIPERV